MSAADRPRVGADLLAGLVESAPARVRRRLDADPAVADGWEWSGEAGAWSVAAAGETVRLRPATGPPGDAGADTAGDADGADGADGMAGGVLTERAQVSCSCLLAPRCLHLLAVLSSLDVDHLDLAAAGRPDLGAVDDAGGHRTGEDRRSVPAGDGAPGPGRPARSTGRALDVSASAEHVEPTDLAEPAELTGDRRWAAGLCWRAGARLLAGGAAGAGIAQRAEALRAAHASREVGLYRLAAATVRVATGLRDLEAASPAYTLAGYATDLADLLTCAWRLGGGPDADRPSPTHADVGTGRRAYGRLGPCRMHGLFSEGVVAASGYAGVVTYLVDGSGRVWSVADVLPGGGDRVAESYRGAVRLGSLALGHAALGRAALFAQGATASVDGRLGSGKGTHAARTGDSDWYEPPLAGLWADPLAAQLDRVWAAWRLPGWARPAGSDLVFLDATVSGLDTAGLALRVENGSGVLVHATAPSDDLAYVPNLRRLGALTGSGIRVIGRVDPARPRTVALLAAGGLAGVRLPRSWGGRVNLGLDEVPGLVPADVAPGGAVVADDPLAGLRRVLHRVAMGGRVTAGSAAASALRGEASRLAGAHLPTAAGLLGRLTEEAARVRRTATGESWPAPPDALARAWMAAMTYGDAARLALLRTAWE